MPKYKACTLQQYKAITKEMNFLDFETERILNGFQFFSCPDQSRRIRKIGS